MFRSIAAFYRTGPDRPPIGDPERVRHLYERKRWSVFLSATFGYGFFYLCRVNFSVAKKPMLEAGILDTTQMGLIGSTLLVAYAAGKLCNGFLSDRVNVRRFMATGLLVSALANLLFGFSTAFWVFVALWGVSGWFQSMGSAPAVVAISHWFSNRERGTRYGIWSISHCIGEGLTFAGTAALVAAFGWQWGFWAPAGACLLGAGLLLRFLADRPQTFGLPHVSEYKDDPTGVPVADGSVGQHQFGVLRNPAIWMLGLGSATMYVARYGINNWGVLFLQEAKGYDLARAGMVMAAYPVMGFFGSISSGIISDRWFGARRNLPCLLFGLAELGALLGLWWVPPGHPWIDTAMLGVFGFAIGGLLVYLGGLMAVDLTSRKATGAALGLVGMFSYVGAAVQDTVSGVLLDRFSTPSGDGVIYDFDPVLGFWVAASVASILFAASVWRAKPRAR